MTTRATKSVFWVGVLLFVLALATVAAITFYKANSMADYSAQAALTSDICERLAAVPAGQRFPDSLSEFRLSFADGGTTSLLSRFSYHSTGTSCTVRTSLRGREFLRSHP